MTPIVEATECNTHRNLGEGAGVLPEFSQIFGPGVGRSVDVNDEFTPGRDAADSLCSVTLPDATDVGCEQGVPWSLVNIQNLVNASGGGRVRRVALNADVGPGEGEGSTLRSITYVEIALPQQDLKRMGPYVQETFLKCPGGRLQVVHGISAVVGSAPKAGSEPTVVAFRTPARVAWIAMSGRPWTGAERDRALKAVAAHLS